MCFFVLHRYRVCQHDEVGKLAAFCTIAKALASSRGDRNTSREGCVAQEGSLDPRSDDVIKPSYCGQILFSPAYIEDLGPDSGSRGICRKCGNTEGPQPLQPSFHHSLAGTQQFIQPTTYTPCDRKPPSGLPYHLRSPARSVNTEDPTNVSATLQQMLDKYPPSTRLAIEKAIANQPPDQRTQTLQNLRASFEASQGKEEV